jgi:hypothetical protein
VETLEIPCQFLQGIGPVGLAWAIAGLKRLFVFGGVPSRLER